MEAQHSFRRFVTDSWRLIATRLRGLLMTTGSPLTEHLLTDAVFGPPRRILLLLAWDVGDDTPAQWRCATIISSALAAATIAIYMLAAFACCERSNRKAARKAKKVLETAGGISLDEVWTVHNKRYDLRAFAAAHPGGAGALKLGQGRNCTELHESYHSLANEKLVAGAHCPPNPTDRDVFCRPRGAALSSTETRCAVQPRCKDTSSRMRRLGRRTMR